MVVLYGMTFVLLAKELRAAYLGLLSPLHMDDAAFVILARRSAQLIKMLIKREPDRGYFPEPAKSIFLLVTSGQEEAERQLLL